WRQADRHRRPFARQWPRGPEGFAGHEPSRLSDCRECQRVFDDSACVEIVAINARWWLVSVANLHGFGACDPRLWRRDVVGKSGSGERYQGARLRDRAAIWTPGERDFGRSIRLARSERDRHYRADGGILRAEFGAAPEAHRR